MTRAFEFICPYCGKKIVYNSEYQVPLHLAEQHAPEVGNADVRDQEAITPRMALDAERILFGKVKKERKNGSWRERD